MKLLRGIGSIAWSLLDTLRVQYHVMRICLRYPTLRIQRPSIWRFDTIDCIELGDDVVIGPFTEILAYSRTPKSSIEGRLIIGNRVYLSTGCNVRAAGGTIRIGDHTMIGQNVSLVAVNHSVSLGAIYRDLPWKETKTGVTIGSNCWLGARVVVLPGVTIGNNSVISAGSIVYKDVPENEIWMGMPARFLMKVTDRSERLPTDQAADDSPR